MTNQELAQRIGVACDLLEDHATPPEVLRAIRGFGELIGQAAETKLAVFQDRIVHEMRVTVCQGGIGRNERWIAEINRKFEDFITGERCDRDSPEDLPSPPPEQFRT